MKTRFDTQNYETERPLPLGKTTKGIEVMKGELGGRIFKKFIALRPKIYSYLADDTCVECVDMRAKVTEKCVIKRELKLMIKKHFWKAIRQYWKHTKHSEVRHRVYSLGKWTRSHWVLMMAKEYRRLLSHFIFVQRRCWKSLQGRIFGILKNEILNMLINFDDETGVKR